MFGAGVGFVGVQLVFGAGEQFFQGLGVVFVARGIVNGFDEAVLIDVDVRLVAIGAGLLAVGGDLDVVPGFAALGVLPALALAWAALPGLDDGGVDDADFAGLDVQALGRQLPVDLGQQSVQQALLGQRVAEPPDRAVVGYAFAQA